MILVGHAGGGKLEYLQLAAILNGALILEPNISRHAECFQFISSIKKLIVSIVGLDKQSYILIKDSHIRDPIYIDFLTILMANMCNKYEITVLWGDEEFKKKLIKIERDLYNSSSLKRVSEPTDDQLLIHAMRKIQKNVHFVLMIDEFQTYFEWVSLFPSLETLCEVTFVDELSTEGYRQFTQNFFMLRGADNSIFSDQKLLSALVEIRQIVKNNIVNIFYSPLMLKHTCTEEYMTTSITEFLLTTEQKLNGYLYADGNFVVKDPYHRQYNYNLPVDITTLYRSRYVMFLELFRYLYDFMGLGIMVRKNYYEAFLRKASEFTEFFKDIKSTKKNLHGQSSQQTFKVASMHDKVNKLKTLIEERERLITKKTNEIKDVGHELQLNQDEVDKAMDERDRAINETLHHFEKVTGSEFLFVLSQFSRFQENEIHLLDMMAVLIEKKVKAEWYQKEEYNSYFSDRDELIALLDDRRYFNFDEPCFQRIKEFIAAYQPADFKDKPLFKLLYQYFLGLYRKLNLRNSMANNYSRIKQFKVQLEQAQFTLNYSTNYIKEKKTDLQDLEQRYNALKAQERHLSMRIEEAEISHMRTEHIIDQIERYASKILIKLNKTKRRMETLLGDSLILACSAVFLGSFSMKERKQIRKELAEYLMTTTSGFIKCGAYWTERNGTLYSKLIRSVLKEFGVGGNSAEDKILSSMPSGILSQETMIESIFTLMFAPSCPYIIDPTGYLQEFFSKELLSKLQVKNLFASDQGVSKQIEQIFKGQNFAVLNDLNDANSPTFGLCQDEALLPRLAHVTHNGFEFDPQMLKNQHIANILQSVHTTHTSVNKRISVTNGGTKYISSNTQQIPEQAQQTSNDSFSFYQVQIFSPRFEFCLNSDYMARATMIVAMDDDEVLTSHLLGSNSAWIDIKEVMLKHFLPQESQKLRNIQDRIRHLESKKADINKNFENAFLIANHETLQKLNEYSTLKQCVEEIKLYEDEKKSLHEAFQNIISAHPLLSSYANVISIMFSSLKKLSKITGQITYSWKIFLNIIDSIISKSLRELTAKIASQNENSNQDSSTSIVIDANGRIAIRSNRQLLSESPSNASSNVDFTLDEEFFSTQVIPVIFGVIQSGVKERLRSLFNLIFAIKLSHKKKEISEGEVDYFFKQLFLLKNFENWREIEADLVDMDERIDKTRFLGFKRDLIKIYPDNGRKIIDAIEKDITQSFKYKEANHTLNFKIFTKGSEFSKLKLFEQINVGFICPDHEFKTKLIQLVYEQLSSIFSFTEVPIKLHEFVKTASWTYPISLLPHANINTISSICTVATYYGSSLEILRASELPKSESDTATEHRSENSELKNQIQDQLRDYTDGLQLGSFQKDAASYEIDVRSITEIENPLMNSVYLPKANVQSQQRQEMIRQDEKALMGAYQQQDPLEVVERSARNGNWVLISSMRFPNYWHKVVALLNRLRDNGEIKNTFRLFLDLQGYTQNEIPDSFLFDHSLSFYLSEKNNSDALEEKDDIWSRLLNPNVLNNLADYNPMFVEDQKQNFGQDQRENKPRQSIELSQEQFANFRVPKKTIADDQNKIIKDQQQRKLYQKFMMHSQPEAQAKAQKFTSQLKEQDTYLQEVHNIVNSSQIDSIDYAEQKRKLLLSDNDESIKKSQGEIDAAQDNEKVLSDSQANPLTQRLQGDKSQGSILPENINDSQIQGLSVSPSKQNQLDDLGEQLEDLRAQELNLEDDQIQLDEEKKVIDMENDNNQDDNEGQISPQIQRDEGIEPNNEADQTQPEVLPEGDAFNLSLDDVKAEDGNNQTD